MQRNVHGCIQEGEREITQKTMSTMTRVARQEILEYCLSLDWKRCLAHFICLAGKCTIAGIQWQPQSTIRNYCNQNGNGFTFIHWINANRQRQMKRFTGNCTNNTDADSSQKWGMDITVRLIQVRLAQQQPTRTARGDPVGLYLEQPHGYTSFTASAQDNRSNYPHVLTLTADLFVVRI